MITWWPLQFPHPCPGEARHDRTRCRSIEFAAAGQPRRGVRPTAGTPVEDRGRRARPARHMSSGWRARAHMGIGSSGSWRPRAGWLQTPLVLSWLPYESIEQFVRGGGFVSLSRRRSGRAPTVCGSTAGAGGWSTDPAHAFSDAGAAQSPSARGLRSSEAMRTCYTGSITQTTGHIEEGKDSPMCLSMPSLPSGRHTDAVPAPSRLDGGSAAERRMRGPLRIRDADSCSGRSRRGPGCHGSGSRLIRRHRLPVTGRARSAPAVRAPNAGRIAPNCVPTWRRVRDDRTSRSF